MKITPAIIKKYQETRDESIFEQILEQYYPLIYKTIYKFKGKYFYEDLLNTGRLAVFLALDSYKAELSTFTTYVYKMIDVEVKKELANISGYNHYYYSKVGINPIFLCLDDKENKITNEVPTAKDGYVSDFEFFDLLDNLKEENKSLLLDYYYHCLSIQELTNKHGISEPTIYRRLSAARKEVKELYLRELANEKN